MRKFLLVFSLILLIQPAFAATFTVDSLNDKIDANVGNGTCADSDGNCTLRAALQEASNDTDTADTITFSVTGTITLDLSQGSNGLMNALGTITITGPGKGSLTVDGNSIPLMLDIGGSASDETFTLSGMTISNGDLGIKIGSAERANLSDCTISGHTNASASGAGVLITGGASTTVVITNCTISNNTNSATDGKGAGISNGNGSGTGGTVAISNSTITNNSSTGTSGNGGGIYNEGILGLFDTTVSDNSATHNGGGIYNDTDATLGTSSSPLYNVTISGNTASDGAGIYNSPDTTATLLNVTITKNIAASDGGGLDNFGSLTIENSILAGNSSGDGVSDNCRVTEALTSSGGNIETGTDCGFTSTLDQQSVTEAQLNLGALDDNGGVSETHALLADSVAIDAGIDTNCPETDQRADAIYIRPFDVTGITINDAGTCDIGAFEVICNDDVTDTACPVSQGGSEDTGSTGTNSDDTTTTETDSNSTSSSGGCSFIL